MKKPLMAALIAAQLVSFASPALAVEENNVSDLADAVDKILSSSVLKENLGVGARKIIEKSFTLTSFTNKIEQIYSELLVE